MAATASLIDFWNLAGKLKEEPRRGWIQRLGMKNVESVADHSFGVALLALHEGLRRGYNREMLLTLAILHDLEEAITGDLTPIDKRGKSAKEIFRAKRGAEARILENLPVSVRREIRASWQNLRKGTSREARLVKDLDRVEMALQAARYKDRGVEGRKVAEFYKSALGEIRDASLRELVRDLASAKLR